MLPAMFAVKLDAINKFTSHFTAILTDNNFNRYVVFTATPYRRHFLNRRIIKR